MKNEPGTMNVTQMARYLGLSREYVSRSLADWGFVRVPWTTDARPRFLSDEIERFRVAKDTPARNNRTSKPQGQQQVQSADANEIQRLASEAADYAARGLDWPPK